MSDRCKVCGGPKKIPAKMQKGVNRLDFERDPFCSRICCERYFGTVVVSPSAGSVGPPKVNRLRRPTGSSKIAANRA